MYVAFIVVSCGLFVNGQSVTEPLSSLPDNVQTATQANVTPIPAQCVSVNKWNKLEGICINRSHCDYGTPAIDFTLYAARGYKRPCPEDKVCCPIQYIIQDTPPKDVGQPSQYHQNGDISDESNLSDY